MQTGHLLRENFSFLQNFEAVAQRCSVKKVCLEISQNSWVKTLVPESFLNKVTGLYITSFYYIKFVHISFSVKN